MSSLFLSPALLGGTLIGLAAALLLMANGRIAGISGIAHGALGVTGEEFGWRALFLLGLIAGGAVTSALAPDAFGVGPAPLTAAIAGLLVGFGSRLGGGCTSGHGVCGVSRRSPRAMAATVTFIGTGMVCTYVVRHLLGAS